MPNSAKAQAALQQIRDDDRVSSDALSGSLGALKADLLGLQLGLTETQAQLEEVDDRDDVDAGIEEARQQVGGIMLQIVKLRDRIRELERDVRRLEDLPAVIGARLEARARELDA